MSAEVDLPNPTGSGLPEVPGDKRGGLSRKQVTLLTRIGQVVLIAAIIAFLGATGDWAKFSKQYFNWEAGAKLLPRLIGTGLVNTLLYTVLSFIVAVILGTVVALMKISKVWLYRWIATIYIEIFRGLPALLVLFLVQFGVPLLYGNVGFLQNFYVKVALALGLVSGAYVAETIRGGIQAVPRGQMEAARAVGMSHGHAMRTIILPQAIRIIIPPMTNQIVALVKDSSLAYALGVTANQYELTKLSTNAASGAILGIPAGPTHLIFAGIAYLVITLPLSQAVEWLERRQAKRRF
ncbi:MAG: amino acid ABC transporter permease [Nakamurella sp.]